MTTVVPLASKLRSTRCAVCETDRPAWQVGPGADHGLVHRPARELAAAAVTARIARTGDVFLGAANDDDCEAF